MRVGTGLAGLPVVSIVLLSIGVAACSGGGSSGTDGGDGSEDIDLEVLSFVASPSAAAGDEVTFFYEIRNRGREASSLLELEVWMFHEASVEAGATIVYQAAGALAIAPRETLAASFIFASSAATT